MENSGRISNWSGLLFISPTANSPSLPNNHLFCSIGEGKLRDDLQLVRPSHHLLNLSTLKAFFTNQLFLFNRRRTTLGRSPTGQTFSLSSLPGNSPSLLNNQLFYSIGEGQLREDPHLVRPSHYLPNWQLSQPS